MAMLMYMPWCRINCPYEVGDVRILPFDPTSRRDDVDHDTWSRICAILGVYRDISGTSVDCAALIQYVDKAIMDDLTDAEIDTVGDLVALACFAGVANREYFRPHLHYCNSDSFALYLQKADGPEFTAISTRRRECRSLSAWHLSNITISVPIHCHNIKDVIIDQTLLDALVSHRNALPDRDWGRWQNAIACFNRANTDSNAVGEHIEWVLLASAFEHLLNARSNDKDVARLFEETVVPAVVVQSQNAQRRSRRFSKGATSLRYKWMREFYSVRGDFAHGKLVSQQPMAWNSHEHLLLATLAFPLVIKSLLAKFNRYGLTEADRSEVDCLESLANAPDFLTPPPDVKVCHEFQWPRLLRQRREEMAWLQICAAMERKSGEREHPAS